jgi:hypothetical protein
LVAPVLSLLPVLGVLRVLGVLVRSAKQVLSPSRDLSNHLQSRVFFALV